MVQGVAELEVLQVVEVRYCLQAQIAAVAAVPVAAELVRQIQQVCMFGHLLLARADLGQKQLPKEAAPPEVVLHFVQLGVQAAEEEQSEIWAQKLTHLSLALHFASLVDLEMDLVTDSGMDLEKVCLRREEDMDLGQAQNLLMQHWSHRLWQGSYDLCCSLHISQTPLSLYKLGISCTCDPHNQRFHMTNP